MKRKLIVLILIYTGLLLPSQAKDYKASLFGIKSDGVTLNTGSIQKAVNYISEHGGGRLVFYVGRYLTGTIELKSNVTIRLEEGAVLVGVPSIYDYDIHGKFRSLLYGEGQRNISITGKGVILGNGRELTGSRARQLENGHIKNDAENPVPGLIQLLDCDSVTLSGIILMQSGGTVVRLMQSNQVRVDHITIKNGWSQVSGFDLTGMNHFSLTDSFIQTGGKEIIYHGANQDVHIKGTINASGKEQ